MGKEKEKEKDKKSEKEKKDKKEKEKSKDKDKKKSDKEKKEKKEKKEEKKGRLESEWALEVSKHLDNLIVAYQKIVKKFQDIDNYILPEAASKEEFIEKVKNSITDLPEPSQNVFLTFLAALP
ncbi:MAG: hypothetical protein ACFFHV_19645 [Promethearchaeota archaeon]